MDKVKKLVKLLDKHNARSAYIKNLEREGYMMTKLEYISTTNDSLKGILNHSFVWACTPEGQNYWEHIYYSA